MNAERVGKTVLYAVCDILFVEMSLLIAIGLWYGGSIPGSSSTFVPAPVWTWWGRYMAYAAPVFSLIVFFCFRMYHNLWRYAGVDEILKIFIATTIVFVALYLFDGLVVRTRGLMELPRRLLFIAWMMNTILVMVSRYGYRAVKRTIVVVSHIASSKAACKRVMIIGGGFSGYGVVRDLLRNKIRDKIPTLILDRDISKNNTYIMGVRILCEMERVAELAEKYKIDEIIIALPKADNNEIRMILKQCTQTDCALKILPPMSDVTNGDTRLRDVNISDLLSRDEVKLDTKNISEYISHRTVLITGGGGSIGSELCRQIAKFAPGKLIVFDVYENSAYELMTELEALYGNAISFCTRIGSVQDMERLKEVFEEFHPQVIFHAAAHKHVHFMEDSPSEAVKNNIFGTLNTALCADKYGVERFVLLSTDKAVKPPNVYGATKRISEMIVQRMAEKSTVKFMTVRFGNVLGSNGSIIPKFKWQIANGGPVTITDPQVTRYFMTIPEACQLVLQAAGLGKTGRIFVLEMGEPVNIDELAKNLIRLSGLKPGRDISIIYTGLRPGEQLHETLMLEEEKNGMQATHHRKIFIVRALPIDGAQFDRNLQDLFEAARHAPEKIHSLIKKIEPHYVREINIG